jgi:uncharacterized protein
MLLGGKLMKLLKIALVLCALAGLVAAEDHAPSKFVRVTGTAEVKVVPDRAVIEIGVEKQDPSATAAKHKEDAIARQVLSSLHNSGIEEKDVKTTFLSLQPRTINVKKVKVSVFVAQQTMTITVRDLAKLDSLLESLIKAGGNRIDSISYETSDMRKYRDQARELAVKAAKEKAIALAKALGQEIGKAQSIEEGGGNDFQSLAHYNSNAYAFVSGGLGPATPSIAVGQTTISASVTVSFDVN